MNKGTTLKELIANSDLLKTEDFINTAIKNKRNKALKFILDKTLNLDAPEISPSSNMATYSPLHEAIDANNMEALALLIKYGANLKGRIHMWIPGNRFGVETPNPMEYAIQINNIEAIKVLLNKCPLSVSLNELLSVSDEALNFLSSKYPEAKKLLADRKKSYAYQRKLDSAKIVYNRMTDKFEFYDRDTDKLLKTVKELTDDERFRFIANGSPQKKLTVGERWEIFVEQVKFIFTIYLLL
jgi:hypothetical protein